MTVTVLRPNAAISDSGSITITPSGTTHGVTSDDDNASYVDVPAGEQFVVGLTTKTLAAGEVTKSVKLRVQSSGGSSGLPVDYELRRTGGSGFLLASGNALTSKAGTWDEKTAFLEAATLSQADIDDLVLRVDGVSGTPSVSELLLDLITVTKPTCTVSVSGTSPYSVSEVRVFFGSSVDDAGGSLTHHQLRVTDDDDSDAVVFDSGVIVGFEGDHYASPLPSGDYTARGRIAQTVNGELHWSDYAASSSFTIALTTAEIDTVVATAANATGSISVAATRDALFEAWEFIEVERSFDAGATWTPVRGASFVDAAGDADTFTVVDHEVPNGQSVVYRARASRDVNVDRVTSRVAGSWVDSTATSWTSGDEWLKCPTDPTLNIKIESAAFGTQQRSNRAGVFFPLGVADAVVVSDKRTSPSGQVMVRVRGQAEVLALDAILDSSDVLLLNMLPDSLIGPGRDGFAYIGSVEDAEDWQRQFYADGEPEERLVTLRFTRTLRPPDATAGAL